MWMNSLGFFLIDTDRNIEEGLDLIDEALLLSHDDYSLLYSKGWGLYKKGKYQEALGYYAEKLGSENAECQV